MDYIPPPNGDTGDPDRPWQDANPAIGLEGSKIIAQFFNEIQEEILNAIDAGGIARDAGTLDQLAESIAKGRALDLAFMAGISSNGLGQDLTVQEYGRLVLVRNVDITDFIAKVAIAPTGSPLIIDVTLDGSSIFDTKPQIAAGANTHTPGEFVAAASSIAAAAGQEVVLLVTQIGSSIAGQKLTATVKANGA